MIDRSWMGHWARGARLAFCAVGVFATAPTPASAWGREGHEIVAAIAEAHLNPATKAEIDRLLRSHGETSLASIANWADNVRTLNFIQLPAHSVRIPVGANDYSPARDCARNRCAVGGLAAAVDAFGDVKLPEDARLIALKLIVHLVGDIHQPLHASQYTGSKTFVKFHDRSITLHKIWDTEILRQNTSGSIEDEAKNIDVADPLEEIDDPAKWAIESNEIVLNVILSKDNSMKIKEDGSLDDQYLRAQWNIVKMRLNLAGRRLANLLNKIISQKELQK